MSFSTVHYRRYSQLQLDKFSEHENVFIFFTTEKILLYMQSRHKPSPVLISRHTFSMWWIKYAAVFLLLDFYRFFDAIKFSGGFFARKPF